MSEDPVLRHRGRILFGGPDQLTRAQFFDCDLYRTFRKTGALRDHAKTGCNQSPFLASSLPVKIEIYQKSGRLMIVADQIAHQDIQNIIVDRDGLTKARHATVSRLYRLMDSPFAFER